MLNLHFKSRAFKMLPPFMWMSRTDSTLNLNQLKGERFRARGCMGGNWSGSLQPL